MSQIPSSNSAPKSFVTPPLSFSKTASGTATEATGDLPKAAAPLSYTFSLDQVSPQSDLSPHFVDYEVKKGDTLGKIAKENLGKASDYLQIFEANKDQMSNPNDLRVGMVLKIPTPPNRVDFPLGVPVSPQQPPAKSEAPVSETPTTPTTPATPAPPPAPEFKQVTVQSGQSLSSLALKHLGNSDRYMEIFEANRDQLSRPESLRAGMTLKVPVSSDLASDERGTVRDVSGPASLDTADMTPRAAELYQSLVNYQTHHRELGHDNRTETTDAELREIAVESDRAGTAFGVDPKIMLAVFAHESGGFNPTARSSTGAGGLGQLTGIAIRQVHYMAGMAKGQRGREPYTQQQSNFIQSETNINQRFNIKQNIWTATAYMAYEIKDRNNGNVEKALGRYGDPNVSTYENKVNSEYNTLFGSKLF